MDVQSAGLAIAHTADVAPERLHLVVRLQLLLGVEAAEDREESRAWLGGGLGGWGASPGAGVLRLWRVRAMVSGWISCNETKTGKALQWVTAAQPGRARAGAGAGRITTVS